MSFKKFLAELNGKRIEGELLKTLFVSIFVSFAILSFLYLAYLRNLLDFVSKYSTYILFGVIVNALIVATIRQITHYKQFACMAGMMIGMTVGMIAGFMNGYIIGATNGILVGSFFGVVVGVIIGIWMGSCCGVMGFMEGIMAGFMGGLMGAMTAVMMLNENLFLATLLVFFVSVAILVSLIYMIYNEMRENDSPVRTEAGISIIVSFLLTALMILIMVFGPRSDLFV